MFPQTFIIVRPEFRDADLKLIQKIREEFDLNWNKIEPHFTLVFQQSSVSYEDLQAEITTFAQEFHSFQIRIRRAMLMPPNADSFTYAFLLPEEGASQLARMHDRFYSGLVRKELRLDVPYIPHITVGQFLKPTNCQIVVDKINARELSIVGEIKHLEILQKVEDDFKVIKKIELSKLAI